MKLAAAKMDISPLSAWPIHDNDEFIASCGGDILFENSPVNYQNGQPAIHHLRKEERFERDKIQFHHRVRRGYHWIAKKEPHRVKVIDTRQGPDKVFEKIRRIVDELLVRSLP